MKAEAASAAAQAKADQDAIRVRSAEAAVKEALSDPDSAQFKDVRAYTEGIVCGHVNAKNRFGGYVGYENFEYASSESPKVDPTKVNLKIPDDLYQALCNDGYEKAALAEIKFTAKRSAGLIGQCRTDMKACQEGMQMAAKVIELQNTWNAKHPEAQIGK